MGNHTYLPWGQVAYEAYADDVDWRAYHGDPMPKWEDVPAKIQAAWEAAADAVNFERDMRR